MSSAQDTTLLPFLSLELEDDLRDFAGAPPMPRMDNGDAFDSLLQRWLAPTGQEFDYMPGTQGDGRYAQQQFKGPQPPMSYPTPLSSASQQGHFSLPFEAQQPLQHFNPAAFGQQPSMGQPALPQERYQNHYPGPQVAALPISGPVDLGGGGQPMARHPGGWSAGGNYSDQMGGVPGRNPAASSSPGHSMDVSHSLQGSTGHSSQQPGARAVSSPTSRQPSQSPACQPHSPSDQNQAGLANATSQPTTMPAIDPSVAEAQKAWPKRKRGPMSEASKEKERARNRRAQKRFREREKERQEQRQGVMSELEASLEAMKREKEELQQKNAALEHAMRIKQEQKRFEDQPAQFDGQYYVESIVDDMSELLPELSRGSEGEELAAPRKLTQEEASGITFKQHAKLYKGYVDALKAQLQGPDSPEAREKMAHLVRELCSVNLAVALAQPKHFSEFQTSRLDGEGPAPVEPPKEVWRRCLEALKLSQGQKAGLLAERRTYLAKLSPLLKQRWELHRLMLSVFPNTSQPQRGGQARALEAVEKLKDNLRQEQTLVIQSMCQVHQAILAPQQTATNIVTAYPYYPDVPMLVDLIASETPGEMSTAAILDVESLPPV